MKVFLRSLMIAALLGAGSAFAAQDGDDCAECGAPDFPDAVQFLEANGLASSDHAVLLTWTEASPVERGVLVAGYRIAPRDGSPAFDVYGTSDGILLDDAALSRLGISEKNWDLRPAERRGEVGGKAAAHGASQPRAMGRASGIAPEIEIALPPVDVAKALEEDERGISSPAKGVLRTGVFQDLPEPAGPGRGAAKAAEWVTLPDGSQVWSMAIRSPGAVGQRVRFPSLRVPEGVRVTVYNAEQPEEAYDVLAAAYPGEPDVWSPTCFGESVVIECYVPVGEDTTKVELTTDRIVHVYRSLDGLPWAKAAGACNLDATCYPDWASAARGVGGLGTIGATGSLWCTGSLLVDTAPSTDIPYFLTANHCVRGQTGTRGASTIEVYWLYQTPDCNGFPPSPLAVPRTTGGADYLAGSAGTGYVGGGNDFTFMRLREAPPTGLTFLGWSTVAPPLATEVTCIHHPRGDFKRISFGTLVDLENPFPDLYHQVVWHDGTTEGGSSGSPMLLADTQQVIGQLWGGEASCSLPSAPDYYGRFDLTFPVVRPYLDPAGPLPALSFDQAAYAVEESDTTVTVVVSLDRIPGLAVSVDYAAIGVTATEGVDFAEAAGTLVFEGTTQSLPIHITIRGDRAIEDDEVIALTLSNPVGCLLPSNNPVLITILNDDIDSDGDGLRDVDEINGFFGYFTDPYLADTDGDGISDYVEIMGTNGFFTDPTEFTALSGLSVPYFVVVPAP